MLAQESLIEFHFIHALKVWVHELMMVILMFKDPTKKQVFGLVYPIDRINNEFSLTCVEKGFKFKELKDKIMQDIRDHRDELFEVFQIEKDESTRDSQRVSKWALTNFEGSSGSRPTKKPRKEKTQVQKKKKFLTKLVISKDKKEFDPMEC